MKKLIIVALAAFACGCTEQQRARSFGGESTVMLEKGQRLVEITWKNNNLWLLTEPMDSGYVPRTKTFYEDSEFGFMEGKITIIESR